MAAASAAAVIGGRAEGAKDAELEDESRRIERSSRAERVWREGGCSEQGAINAARRKRFWRDVAGIKVKIQDRQKWPRWGGSESGNSNGGGEVIHGIECGCSKRIGEGK